MSDKTDPELEAFLIHLEGRPDSMFPTDGSLAADIADDVRQFRLRAKPTVSGEVT